MLDYSGWLELRPKRKAIEAAFHALGMPHTGWMNEEPTFGSSFTPNWDEIERIVTTLDERVVAQKQKPKPVEVKKTTAAVKKPTTTKKK